MSLTMINIIFGYVSVIVVKKQLLGRLHLEKQIVVDAQKKEIVEQILFMA